MNRIDAFLSGQPITLSGQQKAALARTSGQTLLLAVPGSGKTTVIIYRLGYLLAQGVDPDSVLTMTFSRAGARDLGNASRLFSKTPRVRRLFRPFTVFPCR